MVSLQSNSCIENEYFMYTDQTSMQILQVVMKFFFLFLVSHTAEAETTGRINVKDMHIYRVSSGRKGLVFL